jgi:predicted lipoprotein with Yx(FWY)xxD motif
MLVRLLAAVIAVLVATSSPVWAFDAPKGVKIVKTDQGRVLADRKGMTLYTFDRDEAFESRCKARCAQNWPPLEARKKDERIGRFLAIERPDGTVQWTYGGMPLYRWSKDKEEGDTSGHGLAGVWRVAQP